MRFLLGVGLIGIGCLGLSAGASVAGLLFLAGGALLIYWRFKSPAATTELAGDGSFSLAIVGESHYQKALEKLCGGKTKHGEDRIVDAKMVAEDDNIHDNKAIRVEIEGEAVGYLSREDARRFRKEMLPDPEESYSCKARIRGGWDRGGKDIGHYGVTLDFNL